MDEKYIYASRGATIACSDTKAVVGLNGWNEQGVAPAFLFFCYRQLESVAFCAKK